MVETRRGKKKENPTQEEEKKASFMKKEKYVRVKFVTNSAWGVV